VGGGRSMSKNYWGRSWQMSVNVTTEILCWENIWNNYYQRREK
jgi:hypothetical protein